MVSEEVSEAVADKEEVSEFRASFFALADDFMEAGVGKPSVVNEEGTDEKPSSSDGGAPLGAKTGLVAVVRDAGAVCACVVSARRPVDNMRRICRFKLVANMALTNDWCLKFVSFATIYKVVLFYNLSVY